jgi:hypothetical protein
MFCERVQCSRSCPPHSQRTSCGALTVFIYLFIYEVQCGQSPASHHPLCIPLPTNLQVKRVQCGLTPTPTSLSQACNNSVHVSWISPRSRCSSVPPWSFSYRNLRFVSFSSHLTSHDKTTAQHIQTRSSEVLWGNVLSTLANGLHSAFRNKVYYLRTDSISEEYSNRRDWYPLEWTSW